MARVLPQHGQRGTLRRKADAAADYRTAEKSKSAFPFDYSAIEAEFGAAFKSALEEPFERPRFSDPRPTAYGRRASVVGDVAARARQSLRGLSLQKGPRCSDRMRGVWYAFLYRSIHPHLAWKVRLDALIAVLIVYSVLVVPFRISFHVEASGMAKTFETAVDVGFGVDIVLTFMTGYYDEKQNLVKRRLDVAWRYLTTFFVIDFLSVFPAEHLLPLLRPESDGKSTRIIRILRLVRLAKLARLFRLKRLSDFMEDRLDINIHYMGMIKVIGAVVFLIHMFACMAYWIATPACPDASEIDTGWGPVQCRTRITEEDRSWTTWARMFHVDQLSLGSRYLAAVHLVTATLMAVGYGDLYPANSKERLFSIAVQLVGSVVFGFILSRVTSAIESSNPRDIERKKRLMFIKNWMLDRDFPIALRNVAYKHLMYSMDAQTVFQEESHILRPLTTSLKDTIVHMTKVDNIRRLAPIFSKEEGSLLTELALVLQPLQVMYGEVILEAGEPPSELFIMKAGRTEAILDENNLEELNSLLAAGISEPHATNMAEHVRNVKTQGICIGEGDMGDVYCEMSPTGRQSAFRDNRRSKFAATGEFRRDSSVGDTGTGSWQSGSWGRNSLLDQKKLRCRTNMDFVLCAIYEDSEVVTDFPVNPVRVQGSVARSEILSLPKDHLCQKFLNFPGSGLRFESTMREARKELWTAATSPEVAQSAKPSAKLFVSRGRRVKSRIVFKGQVVPYREIPAEALALSGGSVSSMSMNFHADEQVLPTRRLVFFAGDYEEVDDNETHRQLLSRCIIPPSARSKIVWDMIIGFWILYSAVMIPCRFSFGLKPDLGTTVVDVLADVCFCVDMALSFRTGFMDQEGRINTIPSGICRHYMQTWFFVDFVTTFPFSWIIKAFNPNSNSDSRALKLLRIARLARLLKIMRLMKVTKLLKMADSSAEISPMATRMVALVIKIFFLAHIIACFWYGITGVEVSSEACDSAQLNCSEGDPSTTWFEALGENADVATFWQKYVVTIYWVFTTMTTVGYGDITPTNDLERMYAVAVMVFGATVFGYMVGSIAEMSTTTADATTAKMGILRDFCEEQLLTQKLTMSVRTHYKFVYQEMTAAPAGCEDYLLSQLPPALRKDVTLYIHRNALEHCSIFTRLVPDWFLARVARLLEPQAYDPGDVIIGPEEVGLHADYYFPTKGIAQEYLEEDDDGDEPEQPLPEYGPGRLFGCEALMHEASVEGCQKKAMYFRCSPSGPCQLYVLRYAVLTDNHIIYPEFGQMLQEMLADAIVRELKLRQRRDMRQTKRKISITKETFEPQTSQTSGVSGGSTNKASCKAPPVLPVSEPPLPEGPPIPCRRPSTCGSMDSSPATDGSATRVTDIPDGAFIQRARLDHSPVTPSRAGFVAEKSVERWLQRDNSEPGSTDGNSTTMGSLEKRFSNDSLDSSTGGTAYMRNFLPVPTSQAGGSCSSTLLPRSPKRSQHHVVGQPCQDRASASPRGGDASYINLDLRHTARARSPAAQAAASLRCPEGPPGRPPGESEEQSTAAMTIGMPRGVSGSVSPSQSPGPPGVDSLAGARRQSRGRTIDVPGVPDDQQGRRSSSATAKEEALEVLSPDPGSSQSDLAGTSDGAVSPSTWGRKGSRSTVA
eukprot:TRINITY_DN13037_c0_g1_i1.p1 TRINITY_DN13037_c0_g1~~TRINITY_DN13037_c0_g1_i1.p1  ORF type:complete len:1634 (-),score=359.10 TRINITY_DN13037_c0_g1_i1:113-5014(-)